MYTIFVRDFFFDDESEEYEQNRLLDHDIADLIRKKCHPKHMSTQGRMIMSLFLEKNPSKRFKLEMLNTKSEFYDEEISK